MKKIISIILVLVTLVVVMTSCSLDFENTMNSTNSAYSEGTPTTNANGTSYIPIVTTHLPTTAIHVHAYKNATCENPKTCTLCGEMVGGPLGHIWSIATCTSPKTCDTCKKTEGTALGHAWRTATCTSPKTCDTCKKTEGTALGHVWCAATCTSPRTCDTCKKTEGTALKHTYSDGKCSVCGAKDSSVSEVKMVWIPTNGGKKYHSKRTCSNMIDPEYVTLEEAEQRGFTDCKKC